MSRRNRIIIIGIGGHAREVAEILLDRRETFGDVEPVGFIDERSERPGREINGLPILGDFRWLEGADKSSVSAICAVGTPVLSEALVARARGFGLRFA